MKRFGTYLIAVFITFNVCLAGSGDDTPIRRMYSVFSGSCVVMECDYTVTMSQNRIVGHAVLQVQDNMYVMEGNGLSVYCDGETVWTLDTDTKEAYVEPVADKEGWVGNPALLFSGLEGNLVADSGRQTDRGCRYVLQGKPGYMVKKAELLVMEDGTVIDGRFELSDGNIVEVEVASMSPAEKKSVTLFRPVIDSGSEWLVTDLR